MTTVISTKLLTSCVFLGQEIWKWLNVNRRNLTMSSIDRNQVIWAQATPRATASLQSLAYDSAREFDMFRTNFMRNEVATLINT